MSPTRISGWDPVLLISQIVSIQTLHYLTLSVLIPPLLAVFAYQRSLDYEGGATSVGMVMDWRQMAGYPTVPDWESRPFSGDIWSSGKKIDSHQLPELGLDPIRGWVIAFSWLLASGADIYYMFILVRKPRLILDFALTLIFNHLVLTTYYSASIPTSLFFWIVVIVGAALTVIFTEQLCVKREMNEGLAVPSTDNALDDMEMGGLLRRD